MYKLWGKYVANAPAPNTFNWSIPFTEKPFVAALGDCTIDATAFWKQAITELNAQNFSVSSDCLAYDNFYIIAIGV